MAQTVIGMFDSAAEANQAVAELKSAGFGVDSIDVSNNNTGTAASTDSDRYDTQSGEGIGGFFRNLFGSDDHETANRYTEVGHRSGSIVTVHASNDDHARKAAEIMDRFGSVDVDDRAQQYSASTATGTQAYSKTDRQAAGNDATSAKVIEEELQVGKRTVETGGARLRSRIVERPVEETLRLREERVRVERNLVDRPATEADFQAFREGDVELVEHAERAVVSKEARVVEEVSLSKEVEERNETINETLRHTEVEVEQIPGTERSSTSSSSTSSSSSSDNKSNL